MSLLAEHSQIKALFSPEHGLTGTAQAGVQISSDQKQLIPVYSLYGQTKQPTEDMLEGLDWSLIFKMLALDFTLILGQCIEL